MLKFNNKRANNKVNRFIEKKIKFLRKAIKKEVIKKEKRKKEKETYKRLKRIIT